MSVRRARHRYAGRSRRRLRTTALAVAAMAALTASQAPGLTGDAKDTHAGPAADDLSLSPPGGPFAALAPPGDGSYHTELPPLTTRHGTPLPPVLGRAIRAQSGIPATVLRAYRAAGSSVGRTDPGCRLPWELLAAIGKVESGQARGGAVDRKGTTLSRITGPPLNGRGFALIRDTDGGAHDGDTVYDRAVGPMQFLPSTWARWGADGNDDGRADPNNVFDAALAAGHYLCAGDRDLGRAADLDRAVLSYNNSRSYLQLVRYWLEFYSRGVHTVPDGEGVVPRSPGAGGDTPATAPWTAGTAGTARAAARTTASSSARTRPRPRAAPSPPPPGPHRRAAPPPRRGPRRARGPPRRPRGHPPRAPPGTRHRRRTRPTRALRRPRRTTAHRNRVVRRPTPRPPRPAHPARPRPPPRPPRPLRRRGSGRRCPALSPPGPSRRRSASPSPGPTPVRWCP